MGRSALDEDAIRLLEEYNPDVEFDWTRILKGQPEAQPEAPAKPAPVSRERGPRRSERIGSGEARRSESPKPQAPLEPEPSLEERIAELQSVADFEHDEDGSEPVREIAPSAALARLGSEGLQRLRARYAEVMARIGERISDSQQQEQLKSKAERLNPDSWVTDEEVRRGLDDYEATFEELRAIVGRPRKRRRRRRSDEGRRGVPVASIQADVSGVRGVDQPAQSLAEVESDFSSDQDGEES